MKPVHIIGVPLDLGGGRRGVDMGPSAFRIAGIGDRIAVQCDGCAGDLVARVRFISAQAEFTPPIIYSQEERARLVFRVEAIPERPADLRVGQPVTVTLQSAASQSHASK